MYHQIVEPCGKLTLAVHLPSHACASFPAREGGGTPRKWRRSEENLHSHRVGRTAVGAAVEPGRSALSSSRPFAWFSFSVPSMAAKREESVALAELAPAASRKVQQ
jgi:hypothetical protein